MLRALKSLIFLMAITLIILLSLFTKTAKAEEAYAQDVIGDIFSGYNQVRKNTCPENKKDGFYIFVSFSMPKSLLEQYDKITRQIGAKLVIRGFKNNSFKETIQYTQKIAMEVDPVAFRKFSITSVPSFVIAQGDEFDKLVGNVSIHYALEQFKTHGDLKQQAEIYTERLK